MAPRPEWDGDWNTLPGTLDAKHMAAILGVTVETIWDRIQERRIDVRPMSWVRPYRWLKTTVRKQLEAR